MIERNRGIEAALDIHIGRRPGVDELIVPIERRRPVPIVADGSAATTRREARIPDESYEALIAQLISFRAIIERLPNTFAGMGEEALRDVLLLILNNQFGPAGAEMFSRSGKTDFSVLHQDGPVFIAECKYWSGQKAFGEAVEQLLGYLVWRDTKAAVILFVRERGITEVTNRAIAVLAHHPQQRRLGATISDAPTFILHHAGDERREIRVALIVIPVPTD